MFKLEMTDLDELERNLQQLADGVEAMDGEHPARRTEHCPPASITEQTDLAPIEEMFEASGFTVEMPDDFAAIPNAEWGAFTASQARIEDWRTMQEKATAEWVRQQVSLA